MAADRRTLTVVSLYGAGAAGAVTLAALDGQARALGPAGMPLVMGLAIVWAMAFAGITWRRTDEAARKAHKIAAFWGMPFGLLALIVGLPIVATLAFHARFGFGSRPGVDASSPWTLVMGGVLLAAVFQCLGYGLVWAGWWLKRR